MVTKILKPRQFSAQTFLFPSYLEAAAANSSNKWVRIFETNSIYGCKKQLLHVAWVTVYNRCKIWTHWHMNHTHSDQNTQLVQIINHIKLSHSSRHLFYKLLFVSSAIKDETLHMIILDLLLYYKESWRDLDRHDLFNFAEKKIIFIKRPKFTDRIQNTPTCWTTLTWLKLMQPTEI